MTAARAGVVAVVVGTASVSSCAHRTVPTGIPEQLGRLSPTELYTAGVWHASHGDSFRAEHYLRAAEDRGHPPLPTVRWLVRACVSANRYRAALSHAERHLDQDPTNGWLRLVVATIRLALGEHEVARRELYRVVETDPRQALPHYYLGVLYRDWLGDEQASATHLREYVRLDPNGVHAPEAAHHVQRSEPSK